MLILNPLNFSLDPLNIFLDPLNVSIEPLNFSPDPSNIFLDPSTFFVCFTGPLCFLRRSMWLMAKSCNLTAGQNEVKVSC